MSVDTARGTDEHGEVAHRDSTDCMSLRAKLECCRGNTLALTTTLSKAGLAFDLKAHAYLRAALQEYPTQGLFTKCIIETARWGGFVEDPTWPLGATEFLATESPHIANRYIVSKSFQSGYHRESDPTKYLTTWRRILDNPSLPEPPSERADFSTVVTFFQAAEASLINLEWEGRRSWLGAWTFYGAFKVYLLHEQRLWGEPLLDAITMPMGGGAKHESSFEGGWRCLASWGLVQPLPQRTKRIPRELRKSITFREDMALTRQAHAGAIHLASQARSSALHLNSGIYSLGSDRD